MLLPNDVKTAQDLNRRALEQLKKMVAADPANPEIHYLLAAHHSNLGETAQAHAEAAAALKLNPGFTDARLVMSNTFPWYFTYTPWKRLLLLADGIKTAIDDPIVMKHQAFASAVGILLMITLGSAYFGLWTPVGGF